MNNSPVYFFGCLTEAYIMTTDCTMVVIERDENTNIPCFGSINSYYFFFIFWILAACFSRQIIGI